MYIGGRDGSLYKLSAENGEALCSARTQDVIESTPTVSEQIGVV